MVSRKRETKIARCRGINLLAKQSLYSEKRGLAESVCSDLAVAIVILHVRVHERALGIRGQQSFVDGLRDVEVLVGISVDKL